MNVVLHYLFGYIGIEICGKNALRIINTLNQKHYGFWGLKITQNGYSLCCYVRDADNLIAVLDSEGAEYAVVKEAGLPFAVHAYRKRAGLFVGAVLAMLIVYASTRVFWDVRVECNGQYNEAQAITALKELGVYQGANIKKLDVHSAELRFLIENPYFSDIAINVQGTVAAVKLRVRTDSPRQEEKTGAFNVTAAEAGIIHSVTAIKGAPTVKKGDTVAAGDVLITGVMQGAYGEYYIHHAYGQVQATVYREFSVTIPLITKEKVYTGKTSTKTAYTVLGKRFKLYRSSFSEFDSADAETATEKLTVFGAKLPAVKETLLYKEYVLKETELTKEQAKQRAEAAFSAFIDRELTGEVTNTDYECIYSEELNAVVLNGTVELITEIGIETPMTEFPTSPKQE